MRALDIVTATTILLLSDTSRSESRPTIKKEENNFCSYSISGKTFERIEKIESTKNNKMQTHTITTRIEVDKKQIPARINISCYIHTQPKKEPTSAKLEIEKEDSGGRYYRIVNWEKEAQGKNWKGTIAYVKSIFGDGQVNAIPDQFLICPNTSRNPCFYINMPTNLSRSGSRKIKNILMDISTIQK